MQMYTRTHKHTCMCTYLYLYLCEHIFEKELLKQDFRDRSFKQEIRKAANSSREKYLPSYYVLMQCMS